MRGSAGGLVGRDSKVMYYLRTSRRPGKEVKIHVLFSQERGEKVKLNGVKQGRRWSTLHEVFHSVTSSLLLKIYKYAVCGTS